jgi:polysaccharide pyruvyl transferase WcaK-like protein
MTLSTLAHGDETTHMRGTPRTAVKLALLGYFSEGNLGNDATLTAIVHHVRRYFGAAQVTCITENSSDVLRTHGLPLIGIDPFPVSHHFWRLPPWRVVRFAAHCSKLITEPMRLRRARRILADFDALIVPGTGILDDFGQKPFMVPLDLLRWSLAAQRLGIPIYFVSVGAGPILSPVSRMFMRRAIQLADYCSYRDTFSKDYMAGIGARRPDDPVFPDLAFSLPLDLVRADRLVVWPPREIGIGLMGYYGWNRSSRDGAQIYSRYLERLSRFAAWALTRGYAIRLIIGDTRADARVTSDFIEAVRTAAPAEALARLIHEPIADLADLLRQISAVDVVVATRFHNILFSVMLERPAISLGYAAKNDVLMREMGLEDYCLNVESLDVDALIERFVQLTASAEPPLSTIRAKNDLNRTALDDQYRWIFSSSLLAKKGRA